MSPGSLPLSTELYQEGIIIPPLKLRLSGWTNEGAMALIVANSRDPEERHGDIEAQLAAHRIGESRLADMMIDQGIETTLKHADALLDYSRKMTEAIIGAIPDGSYQFRDAMEGDGQREFEIPIQVTVAVRGREMTVDFAEARSRLWAMSTRYPLSCSRRPGIAFVYWRQRMCRSITAVSSR